MKLVAHFEISTIKKKNNVPVILKLPFPFANADIDILTEERLYQFVPTSSARCDLTSVISTTYFKIIFGNGKILNYCHVFVN